MFRIHRVLPALFLCAARAWAIAPGTFDDFEDGTTMSWGGDAYENVKSGGPAGAGDHFLRGDSILAGNLAIFNLAARWIGDYTAAGVTRFEADLKIIAGPGLDMRVVIFGGTSGASRLTSTTSIALTADGLWHHLVFPITAADLTRVVGADSIANILANANRVMLRHQSGPPGSGGTPVSANVGFDNIMAGPVPLTIRKWRSVRTHAAAGDLAIVLDAAAGGNGIGGPIVENRQGGVRSITVAFSTGTSVPGGAVTVTGQTTVGGVLQSPVNYLPASATMLNATSLQILFNAGQLPDQTCYTIDLSPAGVAGLTGDHDVKIRSLVGDSTRSGDNTLSDAVLIITRLGASISANPRYDVNLDGTLSIQDALVAKSQISHQALCP
jgi:hypothetical protein